jgi:outer membrane receptor for ferric coprogen and ferric-rhodotorulic acid
VFHVFLVGLGLNTFCASNAIGQTPTATPEGEYPKGKEADIVKLSPFVVSADKDSGYQATNSISGTRLNTPIKDTPMPIEVITRQLIDDIGATDLRTALQYSAGILLQTQNDMSNLGPTAYQGPGGVNNPEGATANPNAVQIKVRGFVTNNALRDGFNRQNSTDAVNIERVEVVRGPAALLYGTGNFGGVINYLVQRPANTWQSYYDATIGVHSLLRGALNLSGPLVADNKLTFRLSGALQSTNDNTQYFKEAHNFISPAFLWKPAPTTEVYFDAEYGKQNLSGIGFREVRSIADVGIDGDRNEHGGLYTPPGADPRTFRVSGPDTYQKSTASNEEFKVIQHIVEGVDVLVGFNHSTFDFKNRDVQGNLQTNQGPAALQQTITLFPIDPSHSDVTVNNSNGIEPNAILQYFWTRQNQGNDQTQFRAEITLQKSLFTHASKWLKWDSQVLAGYSSLYHDLTRDYWQTIPYFLNYRSPNDLKPLRFGIQGDGTPDQPMYQNLVNEAKSWDKGLYASYQGKFLDDRLIVLGGLRRDINDAWNSNTSWSGPGAAPSTATNQGDTQRKVSSQFGVSLQISRELSLYGLKSEGLQPNFSGQVQAATGAPAGSSLAHSEEVGIKFDFFNGRVSGTFSRYRIRMDGWVGAPWYTPVTLGHPNFDPKKDTVYNVSNFTPSGAPGGSNGGINGGPSIALLDQPQIVAAWNKAVNSGAAFKSSSGNGTPTWYVDASNTDGAAYLDAAFAANQADGGVEWAGFLYQGEQGDSLVNNATMDTMAFHGGGSTNAALLLTDQSQGWDAQILIKPTRNLQILVNGAYTEVRRVNFGQWMQYPYLNDRWPVWNYQNGSWGLLGLPAEQIYGTPATATSGPVTATRTSAGQAAGDDTPKYHFDLWSNYRFEGALKGLSLGVGGYWESQRQYMSGVTHGAGQLVVDAKGQLIVLYTRSRLNLDCMARYDRKIGKFNQFVQLNVHNLLNDQRLYGLIYASPIEAKLTYGISF